jgi:dCMP deaminase
MNERQILKDQINLRIAMIVSELSTCARHQVGSVLVRNDRILSTGRNGTAKGKPHCKDLMESGELLYPDHHNWSLANEIHAEANAIKFCRDYGLPTNDATLYVTHSPCRRCTDLIAEETKIIRVVYIERYDDSEDNMGYLRRKGLDVTRFDISLNALREKAGTTAQLFGGYDG